MTKELSIAIDSQKNIDILRNSPNSFSNISELKSTFDNANFDDSQEILDLLKLIQENIEFFVLQEVNKNNYTEKEITDLILGEINIQLDSYSDNMKSSNYPCSLCHSNFFRAKDRCGRNLVIGAAAVLITTIFTAGIGSFVAVGAVAIQLALCLNDATSDYEYCLENCE